MCPAPRGGRGENRQIDYSAGTPVLRAVAFPGVIRLIPVTATQEYFLGIGGSFS